MKLSDPGSINWNHDWMQKEIFSCDFCPKTFSNKKSLQNHRGIHKGRTTCSVCQNIFSSVSNLNTHMRSAHGEISNSNISD